MGRRREACLAKVQAAVQPVGAVNQGVGVEVLRNSGWTMGEEREVSGSPLVLHRPEVL